MIPLSLSWFVFIYLIVFLAGILILWIGYEVIRNFSFLSKHRFKTQCRICGNETQIYQPISTQNALMRCQYCGSLVETNFQGGL